MNNERYNQIIDEVHRNYSMSSIKETKKQEREMKEKGGWNTLCLEPYFESKEKFIGLIKTDPEFSEKWGLKIEERELNLDERAKLHPNPENFYNIHGTFSICDSIENSDFPNKDWLHKQFDDRGIPTKLITITYNNETIEVYE